MHEVMGTGAPNARYTYTYTYTHTYTKQPQPKGKCVTVAQTTH